jgi:putative membrane protein
MKLLSFIAIATLAATPALAQDQKVQKDPGSTTRIGTDAQQMKGKASKATQTFTMAAASGNLLEVESSRIALEKSQNQDVKSFAQMMIDDHTKVGEQMKTTLQTAGLPPPADKLMPKHQDVVDKLKQTGANKFDGQYIAAQLKAHDEAINLFSSYAKNGDNAELKQFAQATLPSLEKHKTAVEDLRSKVLGGSATQ